MKVAFVGVKRKYQELAPEYIDHFNQFHLELPFYYARDGSNDVTITTVDYSSPLAGTCSSGGTLDCQREDEFVQSRENFDVVVHWRKWFPELYRPEAVNLINCQDHSFSDEWRASVVQAIRLGQCAGILCFPTWHKRNIIHETRIDKIHLFDGVTLGVDTDVYYPYEDKDPYQMLWASDPGRGLQGAIMLAVKLFSRDRRFRLHVCYPDYVKNVQRVNHPAVVWHGNVDNGPKLWDLFRTCGILPFTSTFMEPSSRAHRQAMAAGSMVLYPPDRGSPSELIQNDLNGVVAATDGWVETIINRVNDGTWRALGNAAREFAISENWHVQAQRFNSIIERLRRE